MPSLIRQPIDFSCFEMLAQKVEHVGAPLVALGLVLTHVIRQQRLVFGLVLDCARPLSTPALGDRSMFGSARVEQALKFFPGQRQFQSVNHLVLPSTTMASSSAGDQRAETATSANRRCCIFCNPESTTEAPMLRRSAAAAAPINMVICKAI